MCSLGSASLKLKALLLGTGTLAAGEFWARLRFSLFLSLLDIRGDETIGVSLKLKAFAIFAPSDASVLVGAGASPDFARLESRRFGVADSCLERPFTDSIWIWCSKFSNEAMVKCLLRQIDKGNDAPAFRRRLGACVFSSLWLSEIRGYEVPSGISPVFEMVLKPVTKTRGGAGCNPGACWHFHRASICKPCPANKHDVERRIVRMSNMKRRGLC